MFNLKFLQDDDLSESDKATINRILFQTSKDDEIKCHFVDDEKTKIAWDKYEKTYGRSWNSLQADHQAQLIVNANKLNAEHIAQSMATYAFLASHPPPTGTALCFPTAQGFLTTHQPPNAGPYLPQQVSAATAILSPPPGVAAPWAPFCRFVTAAGPVNAATAPGAHHHLQFFPVVFPSTAAGTTAPFIHHVTTANAAQPHNVAGELLAARSIAAAVVSSDACSTNFALASTTQGSLSCPTFKSRVDGTTATVAVPSTGQENNAAPRSEAGGLNTSADTAAQQAPGLVQDRVVAQENSNASGASSTDMVPIDPEPNEPSNNNSGLLMPQENANSQEDLSPSLQKIVDSRTTSTPLEDQMSLACNQPQDFDVSPLAAESTPKTEEDSGESVPPSAESSPGEQKVQPEEVYNAKIVTTSPVAEQPPKTVSKIEKEQKPPKHAGQAKTQINAENDAESAAAAAVAAAQGASSGPKTWASLFRNSTVAKNAIVINKLGEDEQSTTTLASSQVTTGDEGAAPGQAQSSGALYSGGRQISVADKTGSMQIAVRLTTVDRDPPAQKLGQILRLCKLEHKGPMYSTRGLKNFGNWCYVNAVLQALLACPPFVHLLRSLYFLEMRTPTSTPMLDALVKFVGEFPVDKYGRKQEDKSPFEPTYIYNVLASLRSDLGCRDRQEDAEEFLSLVLNHLHEEMAACLNYSGSSKEQTHVPSDENRYNVAEFNNSSSSDGSEWHQVLPGRKLATARTSKLAPTPIAEIFSGVVQNTFMQTNQNAAINNESFFTLQLSVQTNDNNSQSSSSSTLKDALQQMVREVILRKDARKNDTEIIRRTTFLELPLVLILHLKYFTYTDGSVKKHKKQIFYTISLEIDKNLVSQNSSRLARSYKLFAVVFHHGDKAEGGHYTADVFHGGQWVNVDDGKVETVTDSHVLDYVPPRVPYLLFYRRCDVFAENRCLPLNMGQQPHSFAFFGNNAAKNRLPANQDA